MSRGGMLRFTDAEYAAKTAERFVTGAAPRIAKDLPVLTHKAKPPLEREVQAVVLEVLAVHPKVAFAYRQNTGGAWLGPEGKEQFVRFAFPGCSDILGMLKGGRFLAIECKRAHTQPTADQVAFMLTVQRGGGLAFVARSVDDVMEMLAQA